MSKENFNPSYQDIKKRKYTMQIIIISDAIFPLMVISGNINDYDFQSLEYR